MSRINHENAFDLRNATDEEWATFEKSVRYSAQDSQLDVAKIFNISERAAPTPLGLHDSINAANDATSELLYQRVREIRAWLKTNISFRRIWETMIDGLDAFPKMNVPDVSLPPEEEIQQNSKF